MLIKIGTEVVFSKKFEMKRSSVSNIIKCLVSYWKVLRISSVLKTRCVVGFEKVKINGIFSLFRHRTIHICHY